MKNTIEQLQREVVAFSDARDWKKFHSPRNLAMAVSVEANELLELYLWSEDGHPIVESRKENVADEAADVLICLLNFAERANIDLAKAVREKLAKAEEKYPAEKVRGKALKYNEY